MNKLDYCVFFPSTENRDKNVHKRFAGMSFGLRAAINSLSRAEVFSMTSQCQTVRARHRMISGRSSAFRYAGLLGFPVKRETHWLVYARKRARRTPSLRDQCRMPVDADNDRCKSIIQPQRNGDWKFFVPSILYNKREREGERGGGEERAASIFLHKETISKIHGPLEKSRQLGWRAWNEPKSEIVLFTSARQAEESIIIALPKLKSLSHSFANFQFISMEKNMPKMW